VRLLYFVVDVFTERRFGGNQLAVFPNARRLTSAQMQLIAREMALSETTFLLPPKRAGNHRLRIFTPRREMPFAGHPTLGTAHVIRTRLSRGRPRSLVLEMKVGEIPVAIEKTGSREIYWMQQQAPVFGARLPAEEAAALVGIARDDIDTATPVEQVSTGFPHLIVPVRTRAALDRCELDRGAYWRLQQRLDVPNVLVFCRESATRRNDVRVRVFCEALGIPEDPATGSGNGCLAAYLSRHRVLGSPRVAARSEQGHAVLRPSLLHLRAAPRGERVDVHVGGSVVDVAEGALTL
jgi:trans-2,3-dihydro-3-hydroxyanthranilate isomerase